MKRHLDQSIHSEKWKHPNWPQAFWKHRKSEIIEELEMAHWMNILHFSGGHFNPAISLAGALTGHLPLFHLPCYVVCQLLGGICGSLLTYVSSLSLFSFLILLSSQAILSKEEFTAILGGATLLSSDTNTWYQVTSLVVNCWINLHFHLWSFLLQGLISESVVTFMLAHTVLNAAMGSTGTYLSHKFYLLIGFH